MRTLVYSRYKGSNARTPSPSPISMRAPLICALHIHPFHQSVPLLALVLPFSFFPSFFLSTDAIDPRPSTSMDFQFLFLPRGKRVERIYFRKELLLSWILVLDVLERKYWRFVTCSLFDIISKCNFCNRSREEKIDSSSTTCCYFFSF